MSNVSQFKELIHHEQSGGKDSLPSLSIPGTWKQLRLVLQEETLSEGSWDEDKATNVFTLADLPHFTVDSKLAEKLRQDAMYDRYGRLESDRHSCRVSFVDKVEGPTLDQ